MRLKITIAYDGRRFSGWATQPKGHTVQDLIESAIEQVGKQKVRIQGSGRTDTGVHADGQVAHFDTPSGIDMNPYNWVPALNTKLPATIRVLDAEEVDAGFHARFSAKSKTYTYLLCMAPIQHPMLSGRAWHLPRQLDKATLEKAISHYVGEHDFRAFAALRGNENEETCYKRAITEASVEETEDGFLLTYTGSGFLYKMARLLTGAAVHAAQGRLRLDDHLALLDQPADLPNGRSPYCAPSDGLTLKHVEY